MSNATGALFAELVRIMATLRGEGGCPWDQALELSDMPKHLQGELDEAIAAIAAIGANDGDNLREELGDLLFNVISTATIAQDQGLFTIEQMLIDVRDKIVRRHPHVFGDAQAATPEEVVAQWDRIKAEEKRAAAPEAEDDDAD